MKFLKLSLLFISILIFFSKCTYKVYLPEPIVIKKPILNKNNEVKKIAIFPVQNKFFSFYQSSTINQNIESLFPDKIGNFLIVKPSTLIKILVTRNESESIMKILNSIQELKFSMLKPFGKKKKPNVMIIKSYNNKGFYNIENKKLFSIIKQASQADYSLFIFLHKDTYVYLHEKNYLGALRLNTINKYKYDLKSIDILLYDNNSGENVYRASDIMIAHPYDKNMSNSKALKNILLKIIEKVKKI